MKKFDVVALGECLIDFLVTKGKDPAKMGLEGAAGGAPANVMAALAKLERTTSYITKVGRDAFGAFLKERVEASGVDVSGMVFGDEPTTLAMVSLDKSGNRSFSFYRNETADVMLQEYEVNTGLVKNCRIFHFGGVSMTTEPARGTTLAMAALAKEAGARISFDPNHRPFLWQNESDSVAAMEMGIKLADYVKVSDEEAFMLTGEAEPEKAALTLLTKYELRFVAVTLGPAGCVGLSPKARVKLPTYDVPCVDTTGAGDAFWGAALHCLLKQGEAKLAEKSLTDLLKFCNAAGSLATTKYGAIPALATEAEILNCVNNVKMLE